MLSVVVASRVLGRSGVFASSVVLALCGTVMFVACSTDGSGTRDDPSPRPTIASTASNATPGSTNEPVVTPADAASALCRPPYAGVTATTMCEDPAGMQRATVVRIIDGDTFDATVDGVAERIRIFGVDTPERGDACFSEATDLLAELAGTEVLLVRDERNRDSNGR